MKRWELNNDTCDMAMSLEEQAITLYTHWISNPYELYEHIKESLNEEVTE